MAIIPAHDIKVYRWTIIEVTDVYNRPIISVIRDAILAKLNEPDDELRVTKESEHSVYIKDGSDDVYSIELSYQGYKAFWSGMYADC